MKTAFALAAGIAALTMAAAAQAAQADYYLKIEGIEGEAKVAEWSFGACNAGQCSTIKSPRDAASGLATGKRQHKPMTHHHESDASAGAGASTERTATYDLKTNKGARVSVAAGDLDGDGAADLAYAGTLDEVSSFSLTFQKIEATHRNVCGGKHIAKATLRVQSDTYEITDTTITCHTNEADSLASGPRQSTDVATTADSGARTSKQKQWLPANFRTADMGPGCASGQCAVTMVLTGGQMKHTKTGHVTLMK